MARMRLNFQVFMVLQFHSSIKHIRQASPLLDEALYCVECAQWRIATPSRVPWGIFNSYFRVAPSLSAARRGAYGLSFWLAAHSSSESSDLEPTAFSHSRSRHRPGPSLKSACIPPFLRFYS
ncbi:hypothetical protein D9619_003911 [Psilocybe cf. subviscida]|uniref:Uncharacterized protein n=1 Tax=Psilocybe cf. subviscida TaxID=2480587 RepID=A0A8H5F873_9AGAR|nr:hypothetical protein D9619_003911 [Psilocybe cf. subviscida]